MYLSATQCTLVYVRSLKMLNSNCLQSMFYFSGHKSNHCSTYSYVIHGHVTNCKFSRYHNPFDRVRAAIHSGDINIDGATLEIVFLASLLICDDFI